MAKQIFVLAVAALLIAGMAQAEEPNVQAIDGNVLARSAMKQAEAPAPKAKAEAPASVSADDDSGLSPSARPAYNNGGYFSGNFNRN